MYLTVNKIVVPIFLTLSRVYNVRQNGLVTLKKIVVTVFLTLSRVYVYDRMDLSQLIKLWYLYF